MVSSNKKKRGKQRKATKQQQTTASTSVDSNDLTQLVVYTPNGETYVHPNHHQLMLQYFRKGDSKATEILTKLTSEDVSTNGISWPNISLDQSGIVSAALYFLKRCEENTFDKVISYVGGDLKSPVSWITILRKAIDSSGITSAIFRIRPMVMCMCNDTERLFFKSSTHWRESILPFVQLVLDMISHSTDKKVMKWLLAHEGLLASIVQWNFWDHEHRPDIVDVLSVEKCIEIVALGRVIVSKLMTNAVDNPSKDSTLLGSIIGSTSIVSKDFDPGCMISYTAELIRFIKEEEIKGIKLKHLEYALDVLRPLIEIGDCIDKDVIMGVIDLGNNHIHDYASAVVVAGLSVVLLQEGIFRKSSDTRVAFAIRHNLVEMCLGFVKQYNIHMSEEDTEEDIGLYNHIAYTFRSINNVSLHMKTAKAISSQKVMIEEKLVCLEQNTVITSAKSKELIDMIRSILDMGGSYCCRCNKQLSRMDVKVCNGCSCMVYCSRTCQKEDWLDGHKLTCNKPCTDENIGTFQGKMWPLAVLEKERHNVKLRELEINSTMVHLKLFLDNSETILGQAKALGIPLCDCVVIFDQSEFPLKIETFGYTHKGNVYTNWNCAECENGYFVSEEERKGFEASRSRENITCSFVSKTFIGDNVLDQNGKLVRDLMIQRLFPHEWLTNTKGERRYVLLD